MLLAIPLFATTLYVNLWNSLNFSIISSGGFQTNGSLSKASRAVSCPETLPLPKPFDPFLDIAFEAVDGAPEYSSVHCVATGTRDIHLQSDADSYNGRRPNFVSRTCHYRNLYYRISDQSFHYYASPSEVRAREEAISAGNLSASELISRTEVSLGHASEHFEPKRLSKFHITPWKPEFHSSWNGSTTAISRATANTPADAAFLLYQPFHSQNIGHFVWDDLLSLFSMMDLFDMAEGSVQPIPLFVELPDKHSRTNYNGPDNQWRCSPSNHLKWKNCVKVYRKLFPQLFGFATDCSGDVLRTGNWLRGEESIGVWRYQAKEACATTRPNLAPPDNDYILLPQVLAGTGRLNFFGCEGDCSVGRGPQFYRFRNYLLRHLFGPGKACRMDQEESPAGYITFSLPIASSRPDQVYMFEQEIAWARAKYGHDMVKVVDMASIPMQDQADLVRNSAVFLTNHGGGGVVSIFLSKNAGVLVFWHADRRFEHNFYESAGYFRTTWVGVEERAYVNRTIALIEHEVERTAVEWHGAGASARSSTTAEDKWHGEEDAATSATTGAVTSFPIFPSEVDNAISFQLANDQSFGFFDDISAAEWQRMQEIHQRRFPNYNPHSGMHWRDRPRYWYGMNFVEEFSCRHSERVPQEQELDGEKWVCDPHRIRQQQSCLVYSVGSSGNVLFEKGIKDQIGEHCESKYFICCACRTTTKPSSRDAPHTVFVCTSSYL